LLNICSGAFSNHFKDNQFLPTGIIGVVFIKVSHKFCNVVQIFFQIAVCLIARNSKNHVIHNQKNIDIIHERFIIVESNFNLINHNKSKSVHETLIHEIFSKFL
jgi:hypothetical protein